MALELAPEKYSKLDGSPFLDVEIFSDSKYAVGCMTDWIYKGCENGWINARGKLVVNQDLITEASRLDDDDDVARQGRVRYTWIPRERNRLVDEECNQCLDEQEGDRMSDNDGYSSDEYW
jgi:ribonuclease HI